MVVGWDVVFIVRGFVAVYRGCAAGDLGGDGGVVGVYRVLRSSFERGNNSRTGEYVSVCNFGPFRDLERTGSVLFLYCACEVVSVFRSLACNRARTVIQLVSCIFEYTQIRFTTIALLSVFKDPRFGHFPPPPTIAQRDCEIT